MNKTIAILGSTGSIGTQALLVARNLKIPVAALSANSNIDLLFQQIQEFKPGIVSVGNEQLANKLSNMLFAMIDAPRIYWGEEGAIKVAECDEANMVLTSVVGSAGLIPTMHAIRKGKSIALANKETLVTAGSLVMNEARERNVSIIPVDSEHSAIFQCLNGESRKNLRSLILTASGGPFRGKKIEDLKKVTREDALKHPNLEHGSKITIDSATLMNKGLEVIEARWLFDVNCDTINVVVHPQSVIHSMVEFIDGSVIAQLGTPDMRTPIQYAFTYPEREHNDFPRLDFVKQGMLTFEEPDMETFKCLKLALDSLNEGGTMSTVLNAANEIAVSLFLENKIGFLEIADIIESEMSLHKTIKNPDIHDIIETDKEVRKKILSKH